MAPKLNPEKYDTSEVITFIEGIFGFEEHKEFLPLPIDEEKGDILSLVSVEDDDLSFVIFNPFVINKDYNPILTKEDYKKLQTNEDEDLSFFVICSLADTLSESTVNFKCPLVVNVKTRKAVQVILQNEEYTFRHKLNVANALEKE